MSIPLSIIATVMDILISFLAFDPDRLDSPAGMIFPSFAHLETSIHGLLAPYGRYSKHSFVACI